MCSKAHIPQICMETALALIGKSSNAIEKEQTPSPLAACWRAKTAARATGMARAVGAREKITA
jgi:hypothetical protein